METTTTMASSSTLIKQQCRAQQAAAALSAETAAAQQQQQQQHRYYHHHHQPHHQTNAMLNKNNGGHYHSPALIEDNDHRDHNHHYNLPNYHQQHNFWHQQQSNQKGRHHHHQNQQQHYHQPSIINGYGAGDDGGGGGPPKRMGGSAGGAGGGGTGGFSSSSSATTAGGAQSLSSGAGAAAAIIVVDPPRPPFIPKKPVLNGAGNGAAVAAVDEHHHHPRPHHHHHHHHRDHNRIYAQANCDGNNGGGSGGAAAVNSSTTTTNTATVAVFDSNKNKSSNGTCSGGGGGDGTAKVITHTTTTYIGGAGTGTTAAAAGGAGSATTGTGGLRRTAVTASSSAAATKSPSAVAQSQQQQQQMIGMIDGDDTEQHYGNNGSDGDQTKVEADHDQQQYHQMRNGAGKALNDGGSNSDANNNGSTNNNRNSFGTESSFSAGSSSTIAAVPVVVDQGLHYSVTGVLNQQSNNNVEKFGGIGTGTNRPQRRLSLVGGGGVAVKLPDYQRLPISSFGCTTDGHGREGRIYATAGFGGGTNNDGTLKKASKAAFLSASSSSSNAVGGGGNLIVGPAFNNGGPSIFGLRNGNGISSAASHICLNGIGISGGGGSSSSASAVVADGKSTLSRRAQRLAQKAAHKLTIGSLSSELSSSASALYSLFTSSPAENGTAGFAAMNGGKTVPSSGTFAGAADGVGGIYAETYLGPEQFYHDKAPFVSAHTSRGIDFLERFGQFAKERALIEEEYASKLKSLAKRSRGKKNEDSEEAKQYTTTMAFQTMLAEMEALASQHEVIGERLRSELCPQLTEKCRQLRTTRKKLYQDYEMMEKNMQARADELVKQKKNYEKAHSDAQNAHVKCAKAEKNMYITRMDLEKARQNVNTKNGICEQSKQNYAAALGATNKAKFEHFNIMMPQLLEQMRQLDIERIEFSRKAMIDCVAAETGVLNIIQRCYSDMNTAIGTINPEKDTVAVVEQTKTGFAHPLDFEFEDLGDPADVLQDGAESYDGATMKRPSDKGKGANGKGGVPRKQSLKLFGTSNSNGKSNGSGGGQYGVGGVTNGGGAIHGGAGGGSEYGNLPPQQRCRKIQQKLEELEADLNIKDQSQAGMQRMHVAYSQNPQLGDPTKVAEKLLQNQQEMHILQQQIQRFKELLQMAQGELNQPLGGAAHQQQQHYATATAHSSPGSSPRGSAGSGATLGKLKNGGHVHQNGGGGSGRFNGGGGASGGTHLGGGAGADNHHHTLQQHRASSYSEASSISSADGASSLVLSMNAANGGGAPALVNGGRPPHVPSAQQQQQQQMNNGGGGTFHHSASGAMLTTNATAATTAPSLTMLHPHQNHHNNHSTNAASTASLPQHSSDAGSATGEMFYEECDPPPSSMAAQPTAVVPPQQQQQQNAQPPPQQSQAFVLGTAIAIFAYEATDEVGGTTISIREGDELLLLERDVGDGWTRVRHMHSNAEGYVPTSYLECKWYSTEDNNCPNE